MSVGLIDGRQSAAALDIARGARRLLRARGLSTLTELALSDGRRADIVALAGDGTLLIVEVKSCVADFRADHKWREYAAHCDRLYFAISEATPVAIMPQEAGLILADRFGAAILRDPEPHPLAPAKRRAMLLRFACAAADRLHRLVDPETEV
ncbi:MAG TPA: MmcB family DNA repair protein [Roseiarcus sp.]|nr:MmcB family DNA repair protein [Roseiarcus sp.]